jgi:hypothetical protein
MAITFNFVLISVQRIEACVHICDQMLQFRYYHHETLSYLLQYALLSQIQDCVEMQILLVQLMTSRDITTYKSHIFMVLCADHTEK